MQRIRYTLVAFLILCVGPNSFAQNDRMIELQLHRLRVTIDRTAAFINLLPESDAKQKMLLYLQSANEEYGKAVEFANNDRPGLAKIHIAAAYQYLKMIEGLIKDHPVFRIKFRERLDLKILQAEEIVRTQKNPEALHMLNRAKFFRQRAHLAFRSDQSYNALEYYRLALFFAEKAMHIATAGSDQSINDSRSLLSETEMLLDRASQLVENSKNSQLRNMIERANSEMEEVRQLNINDGGGGTANRKLAALHRSLYRIIDLAENAPQLEEERVRLDFETLQFAVQSLQSDIRGADSPAANQLHRRVLNLIRTIDRHIKDGNLAFARQKILTANRLVLNIYRLISAKSVSSPVELGLQIDGAKQSYDELRSTAESAPFSSELLRMIKTNLDLAGKAHAEGNHLMASNYLKMANRLILKFNRMRLVESIGEFQAKSVEADLQRLEDLMNRIHLNETDNDDFAIRHETARGLYEIARKAFLENNLKVSKELTTMAINLITQ